MLGSFGMQVMKKAIKNNALFNGENAPSEELLAQLDPFIPLLLDAFKTYHTPLIVSALAILGGIIPLGLPSFKELMKKFLNRIFKLFDTTNTATSGAESDFMNSLFKCTTEIIRNYATF